MKRTLLICTHYPLPEHSGMNMRTMNFARFFRRYGTVDIAYVYRPQSDNSPAPTFSNEYDLHLKQYSNLKHRLIRGFIKKVPLPIYELCQDSQKLLKEQIEKNAYDYILVRYLYNTNVLFDISPECRRRTIIDYDDILSGPVYERHLNGINSCFKRLILYLNKKLLKKYEKRCLDFGASLFCSEKDLQSITGSQNGLIHCVVPNVYDGLLFDDYNFGDGTQNDNTLLFVGTLSYEPNMLGLKWFIRSIFDDFRKLFSDARLLIVGRSPNEELKSFCMNSKGIELHTDVKDVREYYKVAKAVIVPLLFGSGTRIKILEAAFAGRPVLSTPTGAEGLEFLDNRDLLLFNNASDFIRQYQKILNKDTYLSLINNAKQTVTSKYSIDNFNSIMHKIVTDLAQ